MLCLCVSIILWIQVHSKEATLRARITSNGLKFFSNIGHHIVSVFLACISDSRIVMKMLKGKLIYVFSSSHPTPHFTAHPQSAPDFGVIRSQPSLWTAHTPQPYHFSRLSAIWCKFARIVGNFSVFPSFIQIIAASNPHSDLPFCP